MLTLAFLQPSWSFRAIHHSQHRRTSPTCKFDPTLYLVTDRHIPPNTTVEQIVRAAVTGTNHTSRATTVQLRDKNVSPDSTITLGKVLKQVCQETDTTFIINDSIPLAKTLGADGVHLGQDDANISEARKILGDKIVGISVGNVEEALRAIDQGADYIGVGAVFATGTKPDAGSPIGEHGLAEVAAAVKGRIPVVAIGGINSSNVQKCREAGADGVAVISAIMQSPTPAKAATSLHNLFTGKSIYTGHNKPV